MHTKIGLMVLSMMFHSPAVAAAGDGLFGLGTRAPVAVRTASPPTFGLGAPVRPKAALPAAAGRKVATQSPKTPVAGAVPVASVSQVTVIRRARSYWTEGGRPWTLATLRAHLLSHRVPADKVSAMTFRQMVDAHDNIHEGYPWEGLVTVTSSTTVRAVQTDCPGGVCPTPGRSSFPLFRRFRR
jgi:hypothetical protein